MADLTDETICSHFFASDSYRQEQLSGNNNNNNNGSNQIPLSLYVIPRENNRVNWAVLGSWSKIIASDLMRSTSVIRYWTFKNNKTNLVPVVLINSDLVYRDAIKDALLMKGVSVNVYEKNAQRGNIWQATQRGSPGLPGDFENILYNDANVASEALSAVTCVILVKPSLTLIAGQFTVTIAMVSTSQRHLWFGELEDNVQLQAVDATLTQWGAKEIYIDSALEAQHPDVLTALRRIVHRSSGLCLRVVPKQDVRALENAPETTMRKLEQLLRIPQACHVLADHPSCRTALGVLISQTNLMNEQQQQQQNSSSPSNSASSSGAAPSGFYSLVRFTAAAFVRLDTAAVDALNIVSRGGSEKMTITVGGSTNNNVDAAQGNTGAVSTTTVPISVFGWLNQCTTASGSRMMRQWLLQPLRDKTEIVRRQSIVQALVDLPILRSALAKDVFHRVGNMDALNRKLQRQTASLRDVHGLLGFVEAIPTAIHFLKLHGSATVHEEALNETFLQPLEELASAFVNLKTLIISTIEVTHTGQHIIVPAFDDTLAETHAKLQQVQAKIDNEFNNTLHKYGWSDKTLKKDCNITYGVHFRVTRQQDAAVRQHAATLKVLQTTREGVRFSTKVLSELNENNSVFEKEYESRQAALQKKLVETAASYVGVLDEAKELIARLDVFSAWAQVAAQSRREMTKPIFVDDDDDDDEGDDNNHDGEANQQQQKKKKKKRGEATLDFEDVWHPLIEARRPYVASSFQLGAASENGHTRGLIISGPNMGGKSSFLRSAGVCAVLAHCGCFVPAKSVRLSVLDAVLCRVGAMDYLSSGVSTFMAEMLESSAVLSAATDRSLVIMDELGRGTSTFDGFGLAWTIAEQIVLIKKSMLLFATHFHEMAHIETTSKGRLRNVHVSAETHGNELIRFLYKIQPGACDRSFGVAIAQLAGLPPKVVEEAQNKARELERTQDRNHNENNDVDGDGGVENIENDSVAISGTSGYSSGFTSANSSTGHSPSGSGDLNPIIQQSNANVFNSILANKSNGSGQNNNTLVNALMQGTLQNKSASPNSLFSSGSPGALSVDGVAGFLDSESRSKLLELARRATCVHSLEEFQKISKEAEEISVSDE